MSVRRRTHRGCGSTGALFAATIIVAGAPLWIGCGGGSKGDGGAASASSSKGSTSQASGTTASTSTTTQGSAATGSASATAGTTAAGTVGSAGSGDSTGGGDIQRIQLRAGGFMPPVTETWYSCYSTTVHFDQLFHIVGFDPKVDSQYIHHFVLSLADGVVNKNPADGCFEWPAQILWAWAPGIEPQMLPPEAGFLIGDAPGGTHTFILQVHYNNPLLMPVTDNGGMDVLVTPNLRPNDAAMFSQGDIAAIDVPAGESAFDWLAQCSSSQTQSLFDQPIHVFSVFLHAHEIGRKVWTDVYRNGTMVGTLAKDDPYDFNTQKFRPVDFDIQPGDELDTHCIYDSTDRTADTPGGVSSTEEMCIDFMMYYPKVSGEKCGSL